MTAAVSQGLARCPVCELLHRVPQQAARARTACSRCGSVIGFRRPDSLSRAWAFLLAAAVFYVPANLLPVMVVGRLGHEEADTIFSGVQAMLAAGWWAVAGLIFVASITVPLVKLLALAWLLVSVQRRSSWRPADRTRLYRVVEIIGHWSMLDVFVVSITVALIQLGAVANVAAGPGATWFAGVVVLTMFAAMSFDPRLIWDHAEAAQASSPGDRE